MPNTARHRAVVATIIGRWSDGSRSTERPFSGRLIGMPWCVCDQRQQTHQQPIMDRASPPPGKKFRSLSSRPNGEGIKIVRPRCTLWVDGDPRIERSRVTPSKGRCGRGGREFADVLRGAGLGGFGPAVEVIGTEVVIELAADRHVIDDGQDRGGERRSSSWRRGERTACARRCLAFLREAAQVH